MLRTEVFLLCWRPPSGAALRVLEDKITHDKFMQQLKGAWFTQMLPDFQQWFLITPDIESHSLPDRR